MNSLKELLATYEKSIERKDQVISNLTNALQKQKDKSEMTRRFCEWKIRHNDHKREVGCCLVNNYENSGYSCQVERPLTLFSVYTHFNTFKKKALGKHFGKR